jgi:hypothetical protein
MWKTVLVTALLTGCSLVPGGSAAAPLAKPVLDAAHALCVQRRGIVDTYCEHEENLRPFVDLILTRSRSCK